MYSLFDVWDYNHTKISSAVLMILPAASRGELNPKDFASFLS
jgi:hypothetical protein